MSSFTGQDQNFNRKNKIEKKYKLKMYKDKELKPKRDGHERNTQTHAGCLPEESIRIGAVTQHLFSKAPLEKIA